MSRDLVLHHYANSPFSLKVRLVLGMKGLAWRSVTVPVILPKPDQVALTGGYRRAPVMQIGAHVYCDSALICRVLDRLAPEPPLYPASAGGAANMIAQWADTALFWVAVPYTTMQPEGAAHIFRGAPPEAVQAFRADRMAMTQGRVRLPLADCRANLAVYLRWIEAQLADGRPYLCGAEASIADFSAVQSVWFIRRAPPVASILDPHPRLAAWADRVLAFGEGRSEPMSGAEAIAVAAAGGDDGASALPFDASQGFSLGERVTVAATDYATDPVEGELAGLDDETVSLRRDDARAVRVTVHFPRIGFQIRRPAAG